jgi:hypothetical protein
MSAQKFEELGHGVIFSHYDQHCSRRWLGWERAVDPLQTESGDSNTPIVLTHCDLRAVCQYNIDASPESYTLCTSMSCLLLELL